MTATAAYAIDADGRIAWVDDGFAALAREHGCPELAAAAVGRPLLDFVAGERPRALQQALIDRARAAGEPLELRYRCDGPEMRRFAILELAARPDGGVVFTTWFESVEERPYQPLLDRERERERIDDPVALCAWCNRVDVGGWREAEDAAARIAAARPRLPRVEHTVCEICELLLTTRPAGGPTPFGPSGPA